MGRQKKPEPLHRILGDIATKQTEVSLKFSSLTNIAEDLIKLTDKKEKYEVGMIVLSAKGLLSRTQKFLDKIQEIENKNEEIEEAENLRKRLTD